MPTSTACASLCLRIGNVGDRPLDKRRLSIWISPEDLAQLVRIGLEHPELRYEIFYGASDNERTWWDNHRAYAYGYRPTGRAEDHREHALAEQAKLTPDPVGDFFQGGTFCSAEFDGDASRVWKCRPTGDMPAPPRILLTHTPDMRRNYYGARALAGLQALGDVVLHEGTEPLDTPALIAARTRLPASSSPTGRRPAKQRYSQPCPISSPSAALPSTSATSTWRPRARTACSSRRRAAAGCRR